MKNYCKIKETIYGKHYLNKINYTHRLNGPAIEFKNGSGSYYINDIYYMYFNIDSNITYIYSGILKLNAEYEKYIKQNIQDLIKNFNTKITLYSDKNIVIINNMPNWFKDIFII